MFICAATAVSISTLLFQRARTELSSNKMEALVDVSGLRVREFLQGLINTVDQVTVLSIVPESMNAFATTFYGQGNPDDVNVMRKFYQEQFGIEFTRLNAGERPDFLEASLQAIGPRTAMMQAIYMANNPNPLGEKHNLLRGPGNDPYHQMHERYHPSWKEYLELNGFYDIFLIDEQDRIVYSVFKELDYGTSLKTGPMSKTLIADVVTMARNNPGKVQITKLGAYYPSYQQGAMFIGKSVSYGDGKTGVFVIQVPMPKIAALLSNNGDYEGASLGQTGETILVDGDYRYVTSPRLLEESNAEAFTPYKDVEAIAKARNSLALIGQATFLKDVKSEVTDVDDPWGRHVLAIKKEFNHFGLNWKIATIMDQGEVYGGLNAIRNQIIYFTLVVLIVVILLSFFVSSQLANKINEIVAKLRSDSQVLANIAEEVSAGSIQLSAATTQQAASLQETVASLQEIGSMVARNDQMTNDSKDVSKSASLGAREGQGHMQKVNSAIKQIATENDEVKKVVEESSKEMESVVSIIKNIAEKTQVINDIVFQTKLLSFNASVEAARAGEHGKGFAVVAEEVGNLANMSGKASNEIGEMLDKSVDQVRIVVENIQRNVAKIVDKASLRIKEGEDISIVCAKSLEKIVADVAKVDEMLTAIAAASKEQATGIEEVNKAMAQLDDASHQGAQVAEQASKQADDLSSQAVRLDVLVDQLKHFVDGQVESTKKEKKVASAKIIAFEKNSSNNVVNENDDRFKEI